MTGCDISINDTPIRIAGLEPESIVDGPGLRMTIFTQGCQHACPGCHNPETHSLTGGYFKSVGEILDLYMSDPLLSGITLSGGEPFLQAQPLARLASCIHKAGGDVVTYTGYYLEELLRLAKIKSSIKNLLKSTDLLVDGPFILKLRNLELPFRGSENQRLIPNRQFSALLD